MKRPLFTLLSLCFLATRSFAENDPKTLLCTRGKILVSEDFQQSLPPFTGTPKGFASGFEGWRFNGGPTGGKGGRWEVVENSFHGIESPDAKHPATASYGIQCQDIVVQVDIRLNDVPSEGRAYRSVFVKATDEKDYVCGLFLSAAGLNLVPYSGERINPITKQREKDPQTGVSQNLPLNEWYTVVLELRGDEAVATVNGKSVTTRAPLFQIPKQSIMLGVGTDASFRRFRIWQALPNPDWPTHREALQEKAPQKKQ